MTLIELLQQKGVVNQERAEALSLEVQKSGKQEEDIILKNNIIPGDELFRLKSELLGIPLAKSNPPVTSEVLDLIPQEAAENYQMVALSKVGDTVEVGMVYPENLLAQNALRFLSRKGKFTAKIRLITPSFLSNIIKQSANLRTEAKQALSQYNKENKDILSVLSSGVVEVGVSDDAPIIKMVLVILRHAIEGGASDVHIEPTREQLNVRFRQEGVLHRSLFLPLNVHSAIVSRIKILANLKIDESRVPQDGRFSAKISGRDIDFRVATFPTLYGEKMEVRVLDPAQNLASFESMGLSGRNLEAIQHVIKQPYGLVIISGPTGSGKTTTLYALLRTLNKEGVNIVTLEDPIEYSIDGINQSQIRPDIGYDFGKGLRQILRQDPNIIMVGEVRDQETASLVIHSALTGHLVFSTLHTNSAIGVIPRLIDMGVEPFLLPSTLKVTISQRLIRVLCNHCKRKVKASDQVKTYLESQLKSIPLAQRQEFEVPNPLVVYEAAGCQECGLTGYRGRTGLFEVLHVTGELNDIIIKNPLEADILKVAQKQGMLTMAQEGVLKVLSGETSVEEITRITETEED